MYLGVGDHYDPSFSSLPALTVGQPTLVVCGYSEHREVFVLLVLQLHAAHGPWQSDRQDHESRTRIRIHLMSTGYFLQHLHLSKIRLAFFTMAFSPETDVS